MDKQTILSRLDFKAFYKAHLPNLKESRKTEAKALCPFHDDHNPSLSVSLTSPGFYHCFSCGAKGDIFRFYQELKGVGFKTALQEMGQMVGVEGNGHGKVVATYKYQDTEGRPLYIKERIEPGRNGRSKEFVFKHQVGGEWRYGRGTDPTPYNLPGLVKSTYCLITEGEGKVDLLRGWELTATSLDSGASSPWRADYLSYFQGKKIVILPDNDSPGQRYAERIASVLYGKASEVKIVPLPGVGESEDVIDWARQGHTKEELIALIKQSLVWNPPQGDNIQETPTLEEGKGGLFTFNTFNTFPCPTLKPEALYGLAGEVVKVIEPHTEADPVALLVNFLSAFGSVIRDKPHFVADGARHSLKLNAVFVGDTSKGRKGTAWERSKKLLGAVDEDWVRNCVVSGLSSGEGLIWAVRDPIFKKEPVKEKGKITGYQEACVDGGVEDKRALVLESEFSSVLKVLSRDGNTLSAIVRQAWDGGDLRTLTKNAPMKATGAHISILGHITKQELLRYLDSTEAGNGFGNRFLWLCVRRSKCLPEGGGAINLSPLVVRLKQAIDFAREVGEISRDGEAREVWLAVYPTLSDGKPGLFGALVSRAEAYVMRIACIYALLDCSPEVRRDHLLASLALWEYVEDSVRYIFGDATGDYVADRILQALRQNPEGLGRNDIYRGLFGGNVRGGRLDRAVELLISSGRVRTERQETGEKGRPREVLLAGRGTP